MQSKKKPGTAQANPFAYINEGSETFNAPNVPVLYDMLLNPREYINALGSTAMALLMTSLAGEVVMQPCEADTFNMMYQGLLELDRMQQDFIASETRATKP